MFKTIWKLNIPAAGLMKLLLTELTDYKIIIVILNF